MGKLIQTAAFLLIPAHTLCAELPEIPSEKRMPVSVPKLSPAPVIDGNLVDSGARVDGLIKNHCANVRLRFIEA